MNGWQLTSIPSIISSTIGTSSSLTNKAHILSLSAAIVPYAFTICHVLPAIIAELTLISFLVSLCCQLGSARFRQGSTKQIDGDGKAPPADPNELSKGTGDDVTTFTALILLNLLSGKGTGDMDNGAKDVV